jgi:hypothetical protein
MKIYKLAVFCIFCVLTGQAHAQSITNWGDSIYDVQLATTLTNNVVSSDSTIVLECHVKNASTNQVYFLGDPRLQFQISLVSETGKNYEITSDPLNRPGGGGVYKLEMGETNNCTMQFKIDNELEQGNYKLETSISMRTLLESNTVKIFKVKSNPLDVLVK